MEQEETIIQNLIAQLKEVITNKDVKVISSNDFTEERDDYMVVVGINSVTNIHAYLKDYRFGLRILIDFFIKDDPDAYKFTQTKNEVYHFIQKQYILTRDNLTDLEEGIVCCLLSGKDETVSDESHRLYIDLELIGSWD